ncbi:MAG: hypothetical protein ACRYGR_00365 [Janthinobacterium lividum]
MSRSWHTGLRFEADPPAAPPTCRTPSAGMETWNRRRDFSGLNWSALGRRIASSAYCRDRQEEASPRWDAQPQLAWSCRRVLQKVEAQGTPWALL